MPPLSLSVSHLALLFGQVVMLLQMGSQVVLSIKYRQEDSLTKINYSLLQNPDRVLN